MYDIKVEYNDIGQKITIQTKYKDLEVFRFPKSCTNCPAGFMEYNCGRNCPMTKNDHLRRPDTCKLKLINLNQLCNKNNTDLDMNRLIDMISFLAQMSYYMSINQPISDNQSQQLQNIADELGYSKLTKDEFRY